jgi:PhnB protein
VRCSHGVEPGFAAFADQPQEPTMTETVNPIPHGMHTITPHLVCNGAAAAIEFYKEAFGAVEVDRLAGPGGKLMHAMLRIGDSPLMLVDEFPEMQALGPQALGGSPVTIHLSVVDADAAFRRAVAAGATTRMPVTDMFWGARYGMVQDPFGHLWSMATQVRNLSIEQVADAMKSQPPMDGCGPGA